MSICINVREKITIKDTKAVPLKTLWNISGEIGRVNRFREAGCEFRVKLDLGNGLTEPAGSRISAAGLMKALLSNRRISILLDYEYVWRPEKMKLQEPAFHLESLLDKCDDSLFDSLSYERFNSLDTGNGCGSLTQKYRAADGTVFRGEPEYVEIQDIPFTTWYNYMPAVTVSPYFMPGNYDPDVLNGICNRLNQMEYRPNDTPYDFHDPDEEAYIYQPRLDTEEEREEFFSLLEELRVATNGELWFGGCDTLEYADTGTDNIRMLKLILDRENGGVKFYMTRPVPAFD